MLATKITLTKWDKLMPFLSILCNSAMSGSLGFDIELGFDGLSAVFLIKFLFASA